MCVDDTCINASIVSQVPVDWWLDWWMLCSGEAISDNQCCYFTFQMFLSFTDNAGVSADNEVEPLPSLPSPLLQTSIRQNDDSDFVTSL